MGCITTTYTFHASLFEAELLPRFLGLKFDQTEGERPFIVERETALGTCHATVLVDASQVDGAQTTSRWAQLAVYVPGGIQHAKVSLLVWEHCVRLIVASANITRTGYRRNREMASSLDFYDAPESVPRSLALEGVEFLEGLLESGWTLGVPGAVERARGFLEATRQRLGRWTGMAADFSPREVPRAAFVACMPRRGGRRALSPLASVRELWGTRRAQQVVVMTPFVGQSPEEQGRVIEELRSMPTTRDVSPLLALPGRASEAEPQRSVVGAPRMFRDAWAGAWGLKPEEVMVCVVPPYRQGEPRIARELHAKGLLLVSDTMKLMMCGSSNFTPHGMGVGAFNVEANLCFLDEVGAKRNGLLLKDRFPVCWDKDLAEDPQWPDTAEPLEEDVPSRAPRLPAAFAWVSWEQRAARLTLGLKPGELLPAEWSIRLPGAQSEQMAPLFSHEEVSEQAPPEKLTRELDQEMRAASITTLRVTWRTSENQLATGLLPVQVEAAEHLLPPEEFLALDADAILLCLLSGKSPAEWVDSRERGTVDQSASAGGGLDALRANDPSGYTLYRTRRLGRALASMGEKILATLRTRDAMAYRLRQDPLGPLLLANALIRDWSSRPGGGDQEDAALLFSLAEICLTLAHVGKRVSSERRAGDPDLRSLFAELIDEIGGMLAPLQERVGIGTNLRAYVKSVKDECGRLVGAPEGSQHAG
ncbi:hypothetical protein [Myxococcus xanthus]|uniref:PLD phosphodiesterase domain-containing protein n=1 Tax=Myxococcus xanthus TaxID=34 RepID=A0A7Y4ILK0_MYXXA|nr:hypothetical protein [Myxococcus xanthus]NOJ81444.1 hypothetical protein [Myxococcus xanthus]NOJ88193.1 hypothetical protein [Myxococcus xanthus]